VLNWSLSELTAAWSAASMLAVVGARGFAAAGARASGHRAAAPGLSRQSANQQIKRPSSNVSSAKTPVAYIVV
jgi:hypothetical protein